MPEALVAEGLQCVLLCQSNMQLKRLSLWDLLDVYMEIFISEC